MLRPLFLSTILGPRGRFYMKQAPVSLVAFFALALFSLGAQVAPAKAQPWCYYHPYDPTCYLWWQHHHHEDYDHYHDHDHDHDHHHHDGDHDHHEHHDHHDHDHDHGDHHH